MLMRSKPYYVVIEKRPFIAVPELLKFVTILLQFSGNLDKKVVNNAEKKNDLAILPGVWR